MIPSIFDAILIGFNLLIVGFFLAIALAIIIAFVRAALAAPIRGKQE